MVSYVLRALVCVGSLPHTDRTVVNSTNSQDLLRSFVDLYNAKNVAVIGGGPVGYGLHLLRCC